MPQESSFYLNVTLQDFHPQTQKLETSSRLPYLWNKTILNIFRLDHKEEFSSQARVI